MLDQMDLDLVAPATGSRECGARASAPAPDFTGARWFAVNTLPGNEKRARTNLERQGWSCFLPHLLTTCRSGRHLLTQRRPLFPSYLFVALDLSRTGWKSIDSTYGVRHIVKQSGVPAPLPRGCVEALQSMTDEAGVFSFSTRLAAGDAVQFTAGPFAGLIGTLEQIDAQGRITILMNLFGRTSVIRSTASEVSPARIANP